jgi:hypothetical protein
VFNSINVQLRTYHQQQLEFKGGLAAINSNSVEQTAKSRSEVVVEDGLSGI